MVVPAEAEDSFVAVTSPPAFVTPRLVLDEAGVAAVIPSSEG